MGCGNVVHPLVKIRTGKGRVEIGSGNIFEEFCEVRNVAEWDGVGEEPVLRIGDGNLFEAGSIITASTIGSHNIIRNKAHLEPNTTLHDHCIILPTRVVSANAVLPSATVVYGPNGESRTRTPAPTPDPEHELTLECLRQTLPNFHKVSNQP
eukprot:TRINITY_DN38024_c0_g1_i1.p1 TRINITY_DN38024_c0_g1~~TRINITY_DN38024_c0_g1_i1.p1  ORF type:complete len:169 (+),score=44.29 TRINITY_DN38024_c0_g1_i1:53-508(+)